MKSSFLRLALLTAATGILGSADAQNIYTYAGIGMPTGYSGDGNHAVLAQMSSPRGIAVAPSGAVYFCDSRNNVVRKVNAAGIISTVAGDGSNGYSGDGGAATAAQLNGPVGLAVDAIGNVFISDTRNSVIRKVDTAGVITTIAGNTTPGFAGDGGAATAAELNRPAGLAIDASNNLYIADARNNRVRIINTSGVINTLAGTGTAGYTGDGGAATAATMSEPSAVAIRSNGNILITDSRNNALRSINSSGTIATLAGTGTAGYAGDGGAATAALITSPSAVYADGAGNIYLADLSNAVRKINASDVITTVAGNGTPGYSGDGSAATLAQINLPAGVALDASGNLYIADNTNNVIRRTGAAVTSITITSQKHDTVCAGHSIHYTATVFADAYPHYQWVLNGANVGTDSFGYTNATLVRGDVVRCKLLDSAGTTPIAISQGLRADTLLFAGYITGPSSICVGSTLTLRDSASTGGGAGGPGGLWVVTNPAINTLTLTPPARLTGVLTGADSVLYIVSNVCGSDTAWRVISIINNNIGAISGPARICAGATATFTDTTAGGGWRSRPMPLGTIDPTGLFTSTGLSGVAYIFYGFPGCAVVDSIIIDSLPVVPNIAGPTSVNTLFNITLTDAVTGGAWSSSAPGVATVNPTTGVVTGISVGSVTITYTVTSSFGCVGIATYNLSVISASGVHEVSNNAAITFVPNPATGATTLNWSNIATGNAQVTITDVTGREVYSNCNLINAVSGSATLNIATLKAGIYLVQVTTTGGSYKSKLVVK